ncbi:MAG TPA: hypothetical protein DDW87_00875, partial [Firmicutes bacterium]|nr:hypothetical protein [Bacillota bacterium]
DLWTDQFSPSSSLSHEEMFNLVAQGFQLAAEEKETLANWLGELLVAHPEGVTRGEFGAALANLLGLGEHVEAPEGFYPSFADLNMDYPGFMGVELLQRLGLLPTHMLGRFEPYRLITRSEAAFILHQALQLDKVEGTIEEMQGKQIALKEAEGDETRLFDLLSETLFVSPGSLTRNTINRDEQLEKGQTIAILARGKQALLVNLEETSTAQALLEGLNKATQALVDVLTPAQINAIIAGDWELLGEEVSYELHDELVARGVSPWEADALLKRDWESVQMMLQERLTQEAADYLKVAPELVQAALSQDWAKLVEYAQVELAQRLLTSDWLKNATTN